MSTNNETIVELTTDIVSAFSANNSIPVADLPVLIRQVHEVLHSITAEKTDDAVEQYVPAVSIRKSLASRDHIVSMIDGRPYRVLKRHLRTQGITPQEYRARYKLPDNYPMVAPSFSEARSAAAKERGLGRKLKQGAAPASTGKTQPKAKAAAAAEKSAPPKPARKPRAKTGAKAKTS